MRKNQNNKECLYGIYISTIIELVQMGELKPIEYKNSKYVRFTHKEPINGYFRIKGTNLIWVHVQDGYGVILNQYIKTMSGKYVNLVDVLSKHYWYIDNNTGNVKSWTLDNRTIYRCIGSIIYNDDISKKLPHQLEVHHKWWKWCNTQNTITLVGQKEHQHFHNYINSRKSHKRGIVIKSVNEFKEWKKVIKSEDSDYKKKKM